jgi:hypothetical protein
LLNNYNLFNCYLFSVNNCFIYNDIFLFYVVNDAIVINNYYIFCLWSFINDYLFLNYITINDYYYIWFDKFIFLLSIYFWSYEYNYLIVFNYDYMDVVYINFYYNVILAFYYDCLAPINCCFNYRIWSYNPFISISYFLTLYWIYTSKRE